MKLFKNPFAHKSFESESPLADLNHPIFRLKILVGPKNFFVPLLDSEKIVVLFDHFCEQLWELDRLSYELSNLDHRLIAHAGSGTTYLLDLKSQLLGYSTYTLFAKALDRFSSLIDQPSLRPNIAQATLILTKLQVKQTNPSYGSMQRRISSLGHVDESEECGRVLCNDLGTVPPTVAQLVILRIADSMKEELVAVEVQEAVGVPTAVLELEGQSGEDLLGEVGIQLKEAP